MRLDKLLANYGIGTRKEVKSLIRKGFVKVNGMIIKNKKEKCTLYLKLIMKLMK